MAGADLYDISHHNTVLDWDQVDDVPVVHKVNEGTKVDSQFDARMPIIEQRTEIFGGYTVLIVSRSTIRKQIETYAAKMEPFWRDGAFTQLDVEPWFGADGRPLYERWPGVDEIEEAQAVHDELLGRGRCTVYINPNQLPDTFALWHRRNHPERPLWLPNYSKDGPTQAGRHGAAFHQYTARCQANGFRVGHLDAHGKQIGIDANRVLDHAALLRVTNLSGRGEPQPDPAVPLVDGHSLNPLIGGDEDDMPKILIADTVLRGTFTLDGTPISPEVRDALLHDGWVEIPQDHPEWRAHVMNHVGAEAAQSYAKRAV